MNQDSLFERIEMAFREAGELFVIPVVGVPLLVLLTAHQLELMSLVLAIHVSVGFVWFLMVVGSPITVGCFELGIAPQRFKRWFIQEIPRLTFVAFSAGLTAVLSGTLLFAMQGLQVTMGNFWQVVALIAGWFIFLLGLVGPNRFHLGVYYQEMGSGIPSRQSIEVLNRKNLLVGGFEALLIIVFVTGMNFL